MKFACDEVLQLPSSANVFVSPPSTCWRFLWLAFGPLARRGATSVRPPWGSLPWGSLSASSCFSCFHSLVFDSSSNQFPYECACGCACLLDSSCSGFAHLVCGGFCLSATFELFSALISSSTSTASPLPADFRDGTLGPLLSPHPGPPWCPVSRSVVRLAECEALP